MKPIELRIRASDAKRCKSYCNIDSCLVAVAAKRQFKTKSVSVGGGIVSISGGWYLFDTAQVHAAYRLIDKRRNIKPFTVILTASTQ